MVFQRYATMAVALGALALSGSTDMGEAGGCLPSDSLSTATLSYAVRLATDTGPKVVATRDRYGILPVPSSEVGLVTSSQICNKAGRAYKKAVGLTGPAPDVHVIRIGTRYIVVEPNTTVGEFTVFVVFDESFKELASYAA